MKIVIVDDDKLVSLSLKTILEATREIEVLELGQNGQEAIALYQKHKPEVLLWISVWRSCLDWKPQNRF